MLRKMSSYLIIVLSLMFMTSCAKKYDTANTYIEGQDYQCNYVTQNEPFIAESEEGYYMRLGCYLYYMDKDTMEPVVLCNKPNCMHMEETDTEKVTSCDAYYFSDAGPMESIYYFDGALYVVQSRMGYSQKGESATILTKVSKDGTDRKTVVEFEYSPSSVAIHRGKVYAAINVAKDNGEMVYRIEQYDLSKPASQEPVDLYVGEFDHGDVSKIRCYGQNVYFFEDSVEEDTIYSRIMRYDITTGETSCLVKEAGNTFPCDLAFFGNKIFYTRMEVDLKTARNTATTVYECNLDGTKEQENPFTIGAYVDVLSDRNYLYLNGLKYIMRDWILDKDKVCRITDEKGNLIASFDKEKFLDYDTDVIPGGKNHIFLSMNKDGDYSIYFANKKDIQKNLTFNPLIQIDWKKVHPAYTSHD